MESWNSPTIRRTTLTTWVHPTTILLPYVAPHTCRSEDSSPLCMCIFHWRSFPSWGTAAVLYTEHSHRSLCLLQAMKILSKRKLKRKSGIFSKCQSRYVNVTFFYLHACLSRHASLYQQYPPLQYREASGKIVWPAVSTMEKTVHLYRPSWNCATFWKCQSALSSATQSLCDWPSMRIPPLPSFLTPP